MFLLSYCTSVSWGRTFAFLMLHVKVAQLLQV
jgi:hypothetical protein